MQTVNERLAALPELLGYDSPAALAKASGLDPNTLRKAMQGPSKPGYDILTGILSKHKSLSALWLMLGDGEPLLDAEPADEARMPATVQRRTMQPTMTVYVPSYEELRTENQALHRRVEEQAGTIADLRTDKGHLWKELQTRKTEASADAADLYALTDHIQAEYVSRLAGLPEPQRYRGPAPVVRQLIGMGRPAA